MIYLTVRVKINFCIVYFNSSSYLMDTDKPGFSLL